MSGAVSVYLRDDVLRMLDAEVARRAAQERAQGLSGRQVTNRSKLVEEIQYAVVSLAQEYGAQRVSLFGSYARGEADAESDVDLLLEKGAIHGMQVLDFQDELARRLGRNVDVVTTAGASERFLAKIRQDEVTLYEAG